MGLRVVGTAAAEAEVKPGDRIMALLVQQAGDFVEPPTPENLADSLSGERFPYPTDPDMYRALVAFRHLNTADRIRAAKRALRSMRGAA